MNMATIKAVYFDWTPLLAAYILLLKKASREICGAVSGYVSGQLMSRINAFVSSRSPTCYTIFNQKAKDNNQEMGHRNFNYFTIICLSKPKISALEQTLYFVAPTYTMFTNCVGLLKNKRTKNVYILHVMHINIWRKSMVLIFETLCFAGGCLDILKPSSLLLTTRFLTSEVTLKQSNDGFTLSFGSNHY